MKIEQTAEFTKDNKYVNVFNIELLDKNGKTVFQEEIHNAVTNAAMDSLLNTYFGASAKSSNWYIGLINGSGYTSAALTDTLASHAGWTELTSYSEGSRQAWTPTTSTAQSVTGSTVSTFTMNASASVQGLFVTNVASGTSGLLWSTALFSSPASVINGETFRVTYTVRLSN